MSEYTKGPWRVEDWPYTHVRSDSGCVLAGDYTTAANARLIAAAPDLLEALKAIVSTQGGSYSIRERDKALAAIAKAEGRE